MGIQLTSVLQISVCTRQQILVMCRDEVTVTAQKEPLEKIRVHAHAQSFLSVHIHSCNSLTPELT